MFNAKSQVKERQRRPAQRRKFEICDVRSGIGDVMSMESRLRL
jgi:hypothetical protein